MNIQQKTFVLLLIRRRYLFGTPGRFLYFNPDISLNVPNCKLIEHTFIHFSLPKVGVTLTFATATTLKIGHANFVLSKINIFNPLGIRKFLEFIKYLDIVSVNVYKVLSSIGVGGRHFLQFQDFSTHSRSKRS